MDCIVIRHLAFEDLGTFEPVLRDAGFRIDYLQAGVDEVTRERWLGADLAVALGGPIGVNDADRYPYVADEIALIGQRIATGKPLLGICLGAQMIAAALGARVYPGRQKEIGWGTVSLTEAGRQSPLAALANDAPVLHWHGDTFDLPAGATLLASTPLTPHQAFSAKAALALQFHPEADAERIEAWLIGHTCELAQAGIDPCTIRADSQRHGAAAREAAQRMLRDWLAQAGLLR